MTTKPMKLQLTQALLYYSPQAYYIISDLMELKELLYDVVGRVNYYTRRA